MKLGGGEGLKITREQILTLYKAGPEAIISLVEQLSEIIERLSAQVEEQQRSIAEQQRRIEALEQELRKDSHNSGKPPSGDTMQSRQKRRTNRSADKKKNRRPGGQKGHRGSTLQMVSEPHEVVVYRVRHCDGCGRSLRTAPVVEHERRQVSDLPAIEVQVTEHRAEHKSCECCGQLSSAGFPEGVRHKAQYGSRLQAYAVYIRNYGLLAYERAAQLFEDLFSVPLSAGTLVNMDRSCARGLAGVSEKIRQRLIGSAVIGCDETGMSIRGQLHWLHVASTAELTYLQCPPKRGKEAFEEIGILAHFKGRAIHDHWESYFHYGCAHGLCNAHHLRELTFVFEGYGQRWARRMIELLLEINHAVHKAVRRGQQRFSAPTCAAYENRYRKIIAAGLRANPPSADPPEGAKRGRRKQSKPRNLLQRLKNRRPQTLAFMFDFRVPFHNNQAERDLRMSKVQQKISGTFRSTQGAVSFCRIRSYISTIKKNAIRVIDALQSAVEATPILPPCLRTAE